MNTTRVLLTILILALVALGAYGLYVVTGISGSRAPSIVATTTDGQAVVSEETKTKEYADASFGMAFQYPKDEAVTALSASVSEFPGATSVKELQIGQPGGIVVYEVVTTGAGITDEPDHHASPISQTKYFYDSVTGTWNVAFPEGTNTGTDGATTTVQADDHTASGLPIFGAGRRFNTLIVALSPTKFVVISSNGEGSTADIAHTVRAL